MKISLLLIPAFSLLIAMPKAFAADGKALFDANCASCHGDHAQGAFPGVPDLITSGRLAKPDAILIGHILNGFQSPDSPMGMPPKGGDSSLTAEDAKALLVYLRSIPRSSK
ncbi:MAG: c-type cytochrome [Rhodanobacter sp.]|nr:MAG: c-type cytochrome [Rhodanobacter sp.]